MYIDEIRFELKDGRKALLRSPKEEDAAAALEYLRTLTRETDFVLLTPAEADGYTLEREKAFLRSGAESDNNAILMCFVEGKLAGISEIEFKDRAKTRHRSSLAIGVLKDYWRQGIGSRMMTELFNIARKKEGIVQVELDYIDGNERARTLYEKMGFVHTGRKTNAMRRSDGRLVDLCLMVKEL